MRPFLRSLLQLSTLLLILNDPAQSAVVSGQVRERGTRNPLSGVNVFVLPSKTKATTDNEGRFSVDGIPAGVSQVIVNLAGYERLEKNIEVIEPTTTDLDLLVERSSYFVYETTVYGKEKKRDDVTRSIGQREFNQAGTGGDPVRAVQNLPGVNRTAGLSAQVVIQGSAPNQTKYLIDNHEVPIIFHFGGLSSVVIPEALDRVDYLSAGYGPEYGRALGGLVGVFTRSPKRDRVHGFGFFDLLNAGAQIEGPAGKDAGFMISARQSYIGAVLRAATKNNEDFNLTLAPEFQDFSAVYEKKLTQRDDFKLTAVLSDDELGFLLKEPAKQDPSVRGTFSNRTSFYRLIPQLTHRHSERTVSRYSIAYGRDQIRFNVGKDFFRVNSEQLSARGEVERKMSTSWTSIWGWDNRYRWATVELQLPTFFGQGGINNPLSSGTPRNRSVNGNFNDVGLYWRNVITPDGSRWTWIPSFRGEYSNQTREYFAMPRLALRHALSDSIGIRAAGGLYYQPPQEGETDAQTGNPNIKAPRAWHASTGVEKDFREGRAEGWTLSSGLFYRRFEKLVIPSTQLIDRGGVLTPEYFTNKGDGRAFGAEALLRYMHRDWSGWIAYTISRSTRWSPERAEYVFPFDQTHLLTALGSVDLKGNWRLSSRVRFVTGNPVTPVAGAVFDADNDVYIPIRGQFYSQRLDPFFQLDFRIDKRFIADKMIWSLYLDILNLTNNANLESVSYSYNFQQSEKVKGLPIVPLLGLKGEF